MLKTTKQMHIGFDFDNTIVNYDKLFHKVALEQGVIDTTIPANKLAVRDHLRANKQEDIWTAMQGYVYGARMQEADAYEDAISIIKQLKQAGHTLSIVSHKTQYPYLGERYDLHAAARAWIEKYLKIDNEPLIASDKIYFELTKEEKIARITRIGCEVYIDDLPEILLAPIFPTTVKRYLFDPEKHHQGTALDNIKLIHSWKTFESSLV